MVKLAAMQDDADAKQALLQGEQQTTPEQLAESERLVGEFKPQKTAGLKETLPRQ
jgi:hypothetical protein